MADRAPQLFGVVAGCAVLSCTWRLMARTQCCAILGSHLICTKVTAHQISARLSFICISWQKQSSPDLPKSWLLITFGRFLSYCGSLPFASSHSHWWSTDFNDMTRSSHRHFVNWLMVRWLPKVQWLFNLQMVFCKIILELSRRRRYLLEQSDTRTSN